MLAFLLQFIYLFIYYVYKTSRQTRDTQDNARCRALRLCGAGSGVNTT